MSKNDLRLTYSSLRKKLSEKSRIDSSLQIANRLLHVPIWAHTNYHLFMPIAKKNEVDTAYLLSVLQGKDKNVIVPKVVGNTLQHFLLTDNTKFIESNWGIPEPENGLTVAPDQLDVIFIPLLAFDKSGNRVGYGKGFYDVFLSACRPEAVLVGLSFFEAENTPIVAEPHDIRLDYCVTPKNIYSFVSGV